MTIDPRSEMESDDSTSKVGDNVKQSSQIVLQVPDWETPPVTKGPSASWKWALPPVLSQKLDSIFPPHKRYCGLSRRTLLLCLCLIILAVLALVIGLAVGLSKRSQAQNLPLPSNAETFSGDLTYFEPALGACGIVSSSAESVVAISHIVFDAAQTGTDPNANPLCGRKIRATRWDDRVGAQKSVDLTVVDRCTGCQPSDLDTTTTIFDQLAPRESGRVDVTWAWL